MAFDGPGLAGITNLSRHDMSDDENVKEAVHRLSRCVTDADFSAWAREQGRALADYIDGGLSDEDVTETQIFKDLEVSHDNLVGAVGRSIHLLNPFAEKHDLGDQATAALNDIIAEIETAHADAAA